MARRYLGRKVGDLEEKEPENIDNIDPLDASERQLSFKNRMGDIREEDDGDSISEIDDTLEETKDTTEFLEATTSELQEKIDRINKIKKLHENFENQLKLLDDDDDAKESGEKSISEQLIEKTPETEQITKEISDLITKSQEQKLKVMQLQLENERRQSAKLNEFIKENMEKITESEKDEQEQIGKQVGDYVEKAGEQKIKVMELQLNSETKQSKELSSKVQEEMDKINELDKEIHEERDELEIEVLDKTEKLIKAERLSAIGELAARVAHDLRNPLSVIKASVELIKVSNKEEPSSFMTRHTGMIERAIGRMSHQIEDVLDFVKPIPLQTQKKFILETIRASAEKAHLPKTIKLNIPENDIEVVYDSDKLDVVFDNLLTNANQAMNGDGIVDITLNDMGEYVEINMRDSGPGIPEDVLPKIFEPLVTTKQTGTGLGLASVKSLIEQHGGSISAKNNPTTFTINLPKIAKDQAVDE